MSAKKTVHFHNVFPAYSCGFETHIEIVHSQSGFWDDAALDERRR